MFSPNVDRVLALLKPGDRVLDIGAWGCPFNRANYVLDAEPYETRGYYGRANGERAHHGPAEEHFTKDTWIRRDICAREPYPFKDKELDFVICSHVLEDVRDPLWVCSEMIRIAKRGYIEVPSRLSETARGWEHPRMAGLCHHRWLVDIRGNDVEFLMKYHSIHAHWRYSFPSEFSRSLAEERRVQWLFWEGSFGYSEKVIHGIAEVREELESYVRREHPYASWRITAAKRFEQVEALTHRVVAGIRRRVSRGA
jgi:hypothetical protein